VNCDRTAAGLFPPKIEARDGRRLIYQTHHRATQLSFRVFREIFAPEEKISPVGRNDNEDWIPFFNGMTTALDSCVRRND
jgi:hypothetical protein